MVAIRRYVSRWPCTANLRPASVYPAETESLKHRAELYLWSVSTEDVPTLLPRSDFVIFGREGGAGERLVEVSINSLERFVLHRILRPICGIASMNVRSKIEFLNSAIASQQVTLRLLYSLAGILFVTGSTIFILSFASPGLVLAESLNTVQALGGIAVAGSGFIPLFFSRHDKIVVMRTLLNSYQHQHVGGLSPDAKLDQYFDQYFDGVMGG